MHLINQKKLWNTSFLVDSLEILRVFILWSCIFILANYCHCSGAIITSFLVKMSDHSVFYLQRIRVDLRINPNSVRLGRPDQGCVFVCLCVEGLQVGLWGISILFLF